MLNEEKHIYRAVSQEPKGKVKLELKDEKGSSGCS
jgi:hypothetical protein